MSPRTRARSPRTGASVRRWCCGLLAVVRGCCSTPPWASPAPACSGWWWLPSTKPWQCRASSSPIPRSNRCKRLCLAWWRRCWWRRAKPCRKARCCCGSICAMRLAGCAPLKRCVASWWMKTGSTLWLWVTARPVQASRPTSSCSCATRPPNYSTAARWPCRSCAAARPDWLGIARRCAPPATSPIAMTALPARAP